MNRLDILSAIQRLACSQGSYGRLYQAIQEDATILDTLEAQKFGDVLDMVMFLEC